MVSFFRNQRALRTFVVTTVSAFWLQILLPLSAYGLGSGPTQPEVWGHQTGGNSDLVNLVTGNFSYSVPITSVPEFPMSVAYHSGSGMDHEASCFGFGFSGFSGAIARNVMGVPDDINGAGIDYKMENQTNWDASIGVSLGLALLGDAYDSLGTKPLSASANVSLQAGYNNFTGMYGAIGLNLGISAKVPGSDLLNAAGTKAFANIGANVSSRYGASAGGAIGIKTIGFTTQLRKAINESWDASFSWYGKGWGDVGISAFSSQVNNNASSYGDLTSFTPASNGFGVAASVPIPLSPTIWLTVSGAYNQQKYGNAEETRQAFGFGHLENYDRRDRSHQPDLTVEAEVPYDRRFFNTPSHLQRDFFLINAAGLNGSMQMYRDEYAVFSRNYRRSETKFTGMLTKERNRNETVPWTGVNQANINKSIDVLAFIKNDNEEDRDFDKNLFIEKELVDLTADDRKYNKSKPEFKLRGDLAGSLNIGSSDYKDAGVNAYDLIHISGNGESNFGFLRTEKEMPMYMPAIPQEVKAKYENPNLKVERSTHIEYSSIGEITTALGNLGAQYTGQAGQFKFLQSFYSHYTLNQAGKNQARTSIYALNDYVDTFSILDHIADLKSGRAYMDDLIGSVKVTNASGLTYYFNLPVFHKEKKTTSLAGKGQNPPVSEAGDYASFLNGNNKVRNRNKVEATETYYYPYAWLLTAMVGPDYIDFDSIPGPSDGDLGTWVKFKYVKAADDYRWRAPFTGMDHLPGVIHTDIDDRYMAASGIKEVYYLSEVETPSSMARYHYHKRLDGVDANAHWNGDAENALNGLRSTTTVFDPLGDNYLFAVTQIDRFNKHPHADHSQIRDAADPFGPPVASTKFWYDYSVCPNVPNNLNLYGNPQFRVKIQDLPYHVGNGDPAVNQGANAKAGKLTLRKVRTISYTDSGVPVPLPSTEFRYGFDESPDEEYNPPYDPYQRDRWGHYSKRARLASTHIPGTYHYSPYTEVDPVQADANAQAFQLKKVRMAGGGELEVDYQANAYGYVQQYLPFEMRHVRDLEADGEETKLFVEMTDLARDGKDLSEILSPDETAYGEISFYQEPNQPREDQLFVASEDVKVSSLGSVTQIGSRFYQWVHVRSTDPDITDPPFLTAVENYMYTESIQMKVIKERGNAQGCNFAPFIQKYRDLEQNGALDAATKIVNYTKDYFTKDLTYRSRFDGCFGTPGSALFEHQSFFRTTAYKGKFTGSRAMRTTFRDNFQYATGPNRSVVPHSNEYVTNYFYQEGPRSQGRELGVATIEPGGGKAAVVDMAETRGAVFYPSPMIMQSRSSVETGYDAEAATANVGDLISREKGTMVYEFMSPRDRGYQVDQAVKASLLKQAPGNPKGRFYLFGLWSFLMFKFQIRILGVTKNIQFKIPFYFPVLIDWRRSDQYNLKSYAYTDFTDIYGRPKRRAALDVNGQEVSWTEFDYYRPDEGIPMYQNGFDQLDTLRPGRMDQVWSEAHYDKATKVKRIRPLMMLKANTERNFNYTNVKYSYVPPMVRSVTSSQSGLIQKVENTGFDYWTGQGVESRTEDSKQNTIIARTTPAYWDYPEMGPMDANPDQLNMLLPQDGATRYLDDAVPAKVTGVDATVWSKDAYDFVDYWRPLRERQANGDWRYVWEPISGQEIKDAYLLQTDPRISDQHIGGAKYLYKPVRVFNYETDLDNRGIYEQFTPFDHQLATQTDANWIERAFLKLHDVKRRNVETVDVLDNYASSHFTHGNFYKETESVDAAYHEVVFEGGENTYLQQPGGNVILDEDRVALGDATIVTGGCARSSLQVSTDFMSFTGLVPAHLVRICDPAPGVYDQPFAKIDVTFQPNPVVSRSLFLYRETDGEYKAITNYGEPFTGFVTMDHEGCTLMVFDPAKFGSFELDQSFPSQGYAFNFSDGTLPECNYAPVFYEVPSNNCPAPVHTGSYAFELGAGQTGTITNLQAAKVPGGSFDRAYKAMVWVHQSSPGGTELVMEVRNNGTPVHTVTMNALQPYSNAGEWNLLRLQVEAAQAALGDEIVVYVRNAAQQGTALYDDLHVSPFQSSSVTSVYEHRRVRISASLDNTHHAAFFEYDDRNRLIEQQVEMVNEGKKVTRRMRYNDQKKQ